MYKKIVIALMFGFAMSLKAQTYKAMTYNIRYDNVNDGENQWFKRKEFLTNQMAYNAPDILGIQEGLHHQVKYIDSVLTQYKYIGVGRDDGKIKGEYSAIFYDDRKLEVINQGTFWLSKTPEEISVGWDAAMERICTYGLFIDKTTDQQFFVFNTHFDHIGNMAREESAKLILKKATILNKNNLPVIIMGDFNLLPESKAIRFLSKRVNDSRDISILKPFGPVGTSNRFQFNKPVTKRIDYIFTSKGNIEVLKYAILSDAVNCRYPSDHLPVIIELKITN